MKSKVEFYIVNDKGDKIVCARNKGCNGVGLGTLTQHGIVLDDEHVHNLVFAPYDLVALADFVKKQLEGGAE